ncbi:conserved hypothetical protein [Gloeothece citriformis PCC 7424]|uniref:Peptidase A2 domain-containing protein n=1 Tax=Gloeothece citriformis (strain PCC 7424) TaxID=65393 RepID=B7KEG1_GLOC7|nr:retropepsin-like aspartic protease [Gloeothece citriformis]ACK73279.1 conserved hypothetical protein [Gloeothece citriformis PCC 7424]
MKVFKKPLIQYIISPIVGGLTLFLPSVTLGESSTPPPLSIQEQKIAEDLINCISDSFTSEQSGSQQTLETTSLKCFYQIIYLDQNGEIRPDAEDRLKTLVKLTGVALPTPIREGKATIQLEKLPNTDIFTLPVTIEGNTQKFILDLGASNSIITRELAQQLKLQSIIIPSEILEYMVVGQSCANIEAAMHPFPKVAINAATAQGLMGLGLSNFVFSEAISGVVGLDFFSGFDLLINPQSLQLEILPSSAIKSKAIPLKGKMGLMTTEVYINGKGPFTFLLDTGAEKMVISEKLAQTLNMTKLEQQEVRGFCGNEPAYSTQVNQVRLQDHTLNDLEGVIVNTEVLEVLGIDGIVGQNFLNQYQQHWQFSSPNELGFPETGGLTLNPLMK